MLLVGLLPYRLPAASRSFKSCKPYFCCLLSSSSKTIGEGSGERYQRTRGSTLSQDSLGSSSYKKMDGEECRERHLRTQGSQHSFESIFDVRASCYKKDEPSLSVRHRNAQASPERMIDKIVPFDICKPQTGSTPKLKPSLLVKNKEKRRAECSKHSVPHQRIRPGMILLKNFISHSDQVEIVKECQKLGLGPGGFYNPGYTDGTKLHLQMMCLGKDWDPVTKYNDIRTSDGAEPPKIPEKFKKLVEDAIQTSHTLKQTKKYCFEKDEIPTMSPDICIVNFYSRSGRLGLHQDKDESEDSLSKELPVVSFSLGDSADFLYSDGRDVDTADKVVLESGDVVIFGGKSRNIFHGIRSIQPNTAPKFLIDETELKPGRLNLTFRKY